MTIKMTMTIKRRRKRLMTIKRMENNITNRTI
jgi:hypothetical protein